MPLWDDTRAAWGARPPAAALSYVAPADRTEFMVHYDGGTPLGPWADHARCLERVKADQAFHVDSNGWSDIGYNGLVCQHGRAIEGRGIDYQGAHCPNHNRSAYGVQFMVGGAQAPSDAAKARMRGLYDACLTRSGHALAKRGHRDGYATECPGTLAYAWVTAGMPYPTPQEDDLATITEDNARDLFTGYAILKDVRAANPDTAPRVAPSALIEYAAAQAKANATLLAALTPKALAAAIAAELPPDPLVSRADIEAALRTVLGSVDQVVGQ